MARPRAADDFAAIKARMDELRRERAQVARGGAAETANETGRYPRSRSPQPAADQALKRVRELLAR